MKTLSALTLGISFGLIASHTLAAVALFALAAALMGARV